MSLALALGLLPRLGLALRAPLSRIALLTLLSGRVLVLSLGLTRRRSLGFAMALSLAVRLLLGLPLGLGLRLALRLRLRLALLLRLMRGWPALPLLFVLLTRLTAFAAVRVLLLRPGGAARQRGGRQQGGEDGSVHGAGDLCSGALRDAVRPDGVTRRPRFRSMPPSSAPDRTVCIGALASMLPNQAASSASSR